jgi:predicted nucleic-acid-binding Zn-ribbon protein
MALSTCIKCGHHMFELSEAEPNGSNVKLFFVQCASCGGVVGVTDYCNTALTLEKLSNKLGVGSLL